ncbi:TonB-dependent receptor [Sediminibacterium soli]|uniref:TonB-dependent receptor n=1 Tax=Sediminibacterium soli TaxID=2698829 RepID=UPI001379531B|nr:TonB-dependent receptor [Sediminibacterium soli]NCI47498.1 TonB-dependent receptor [Sediminibacterium soli]
MPKLLGIFIYVLVSVDVYAQTASVNGTVTDSHGLPVSSASIRLLNMATEAITDTKGFYLIEKLSPGNYTVFFSLVGYKTQKKTVLLHDNEALALNFIAEEADGLLNEVVVTAGRGRELLSEIPASVTVVNSQAIKKYLAQTSNITDILELQVPGLASGTGTYFNWGQTMRGRDFLVMVNGIPQSTPLIPGQAEIKSILPNDVERIEVIKGASAAFGVGGTGGVINYITKQAPASSGGLQGTTSLWGTSNLANTKDAQGFGIHQSLYGNSKKWNYYAGLSYEQTGNKYSPNKKTLFPIYGLDNTKILSLYWNIGYAITGKQHIAFSGNVYQSKLETPFAPYNSSIEVYNAVGDYTIIPGYGTPKTSNDPEKPTGLSTANAALTYTATDIFQRTTTFTTDVYYAKSKNVFYYSPNFFEGGGQSAIYSEKYGIRPNFNTRIKYKNLDWTLTYGLDILKDKTSRTLLDGRIWIPQLDLVSIAPYIQSAFKIQDSWVLKAGLRYDNMSLRSDAYGTLPTLRADGTYNKSNPINAGREDFRNVSFNIGLRYVKYKDFSPYINFSQGYTLPNVGRILQGATNADIVRTLNLSAPVTDNYELGFLSYIGKLRFEATGYYSTSKTGAGLVYNNAENRYEPAKTPQKIYGADISVGVAILKDKLDMGATYSYVEGITYKADNPYQLFYINSEFIAAPKATAFIAYNPIAKIKLLFSGVHMGNRNRFAPVPNGNGGWKYNYAEVPLKQYTVFNLSAQYQITEKMGTSLAINNLFNTTYLPARSQWAAPLRDKTVLGEGINMRIGVNYRF